MKDAKQKTSNKFVLKNLPLNLQKVQTRIEQIQFSYSKNISMRWWILKVIKQAWKDC